jgi:hypothetical protein
MINARRVASIDSRDRGRRPSSIAFIIGCGRSGTTVLGDILASHPSIRYLFEPTYLWNAITPLTDCGNLFGSGNGHVILDEEDVTEGIRDRFLNVVHSLRVSKDGLIVEKTPHNAMRIGFLRGLAPRAKYIHIYRDGVEVAASIARLAISNSYRIAFRPAHNQWWGTHHSKWTVLAEEGARRDYFPSEVPLLEDDFQRGAYEWLVSLLEVDRWRSALGPALLDLSYPELIRQPAEAICRICDHLGLPCSAGWIATAGAMIAQQPQVPLPALTLPPRMCEAFNRYQRVFGFSNRALSAEGPDQP